MTFAAELDILRLGAKGEGVADGPAGPVYLPDTLPGERVLAEIDGERGLVIDLLGRSPDRVQPICPYFGTCGGCATQSLAPVLYRSWKQGLLVQALSMAHVDAPVDPMLPAHGEGRRRATFHARAAARVNMLAAAPPAVGFMQARSHAIVAIEHCPILAPAMAGALPAARRLAALLARLGKPLDLLVTATATGLDVDLRGCGPLDAALRSAIVTASAAADCARVSNHGEVLIERRAPLLRMGRASVHLPPGCFLQATEAGEAALVTLVVEWVGRSRRVLDLFSGVGTFALRLAERATVHAVDAEATPLAALARAARDTPALRPVTTETRDLFRRPFGPADLAGFDAVVFDPPRAGAAAQAEQLAASAVPRVVAVSCHPASFARDAAILLRGGYVVERVTPVDQFIYAPHLELVAVFTRPPGSRRRSLLS